MQLLKEGLETNQVIETNHIRRLTIDGHTQEFKIYKIRLDILYYNDQNDRIATWISKYKLDNNITEFNKSDKNSYNSIIHNFIADSNLDSLKRTQKNIEMVGQNHPGVVLNDGRIIDGNRRFTCLRNIQSEKVESQYFEAMILDRDINTSKKEIKMLELKLQHGEDEKVNYQPIDRLVGIYNDIVDSNLLTVEEYAASVDKEVRDIKK